MMEEVEVIIRPRTYNLGTHSLDGLLSDERGVKVIFESGLGSDGFVWREIMEEIGKTDQTLAYHRAGYASSQLGPTPRDLVQLSDELLALKEKVALNEKVVLVGHSWGGAIIRAFAVRFPDQVLAMVFVDTSHERELILTQEQEDEVVRNYSGLVGASREAAQLIEGVEYLKTLGDLPDVPVTVMTNSPGGVNTAWARYHRSLGAHLTPSNFDQMITTTGHNIHTLEPELVIQAIHGVIKKSK